MYPIKMIFLCLYIDWLNNATYSHFTNFILLFTECQKLPIHHLPGGLEPSPNATGWEAVYTDTDSDSVLWAILESPVNLPLLLWVGRETPHRKAPARWWTFLIFLFLCLILSLVPMEMINALVLTYHYSTQLKPLHTTCLIHSPNLCLSVF